MDKENKSGVFQKLGYIFSKQDKIKIALLLVAIIMGSLLELLGVTIFMPFINIIQKPETTERTWYLKYVYNLFAFNSTEGFLTALSVGIIFVYVVKNIYLVVEKKCIFRFSYNMQMRLSTRLLDTYMKEPYTFHLNKNIATLQRILQEDTTKFLQVVLYSLELIAELAVCFVIGIYLFIVSKTISITVIGLLALCIGLFLTITKKYNHKLGVENQRHQAKLFQWRNQALGGVKEIKILERESYFVEQYQKYFTKFSRGLIIGRTISIMSKYIIEAVCITGLLIAIIVKMFWGEADIVYYVPQLTVFAVAAFRLMPSVGKINEHVSNIIYAFPAVDLIYNDLKEIEEFVDKTNNEEKEDWILKGGISIEQVTYYYPNTETPVIQDANFVIPKGKTIAFIGTSGAGKTTMVDIILGLLSPQKGRVMADELNVHEKLKTWHSQIGYIPQMIYLSDDTIRNNIAFGIKENDINENSIEDAVQKAQLSDFIRNLPEGLDTVVGERGIRLSGGQKQRIGIARALYHNPEILVLDEATSALDNETEAAVMEAIENLKGIKTMIIIAHRLTTIRNVDDIYEVCDGKVIEKDKFDVFH